MLRFIVALIAVSVAAGACASATRMEVPTNNGGLLDCTSQTIVYAHFDYGPDAQGTTAASDALITLTADAGRPPGTPQLESERSAVATFVFTDEESNRLGRASVMHIENGWVVKWTERCG